MRRENARTRGFPARLWRAHDGDTFTVLADCGFECAATPTLRLLDVYAPELLPMALPARGQPGAAETTDFVNGWMASAEGEASPRYWYLWVETILTKAPDPSERRTFARYLASVWRMVDCPVWGQGGAPNFSLNYQVALFLSGHPEWPPGE